MAAFADLAAAEARAKAKVADGTWINAHSCYASGTATPAVRFQRKASSTSDATRAYGGWYETTDDATV